MERKIGEIFEYDGEWYQVVECSKDNYPCIGCYGCKGVGGARINGGECNGNARKDNKFVIFKKLEKVEEPIQFGNKIMQRYKVFVKPYVLKELEHFNIDSTRDLTILIEIKQNKEDIEENKITFPKEDNALTRTVYAYVNGKISDKELIRSIKEMSDEYPYNKNNLKPFSLELAKQGKPVCTRDGRKARIICFDRNDLYPIVALIECKDGKEIIGAYSNDGNTEIYEIKGTDLMMLSEKKEGWVNVYKTSINYECGTVFSTEQESKNKTNDNRIATVRIEWEE